MAWFTPFIIPAVMNAPQFLRSGNIGQYVKNTGVQGATNTAIGNIAPNFNMSPAGNFGSVQNATNVPSMLQSGANVATQPVSTSMMQTLAQPPVSTAPSTSMMDTLARQTTGSGMPSALPPQPNTPPILTSDATRLGIEEPKQAVFTGDRFVQESIRPRLEDVQKVTETGIESGGYEDPLTTQVFKKVTDYVKEKPFEAAMLGMMGGGAIYEGLKGPERPPLQPTLGPKLGGGQVNVGAPLQVKRTRRR